MQVKVTWSEESYEWAMSLRGEMSAAAAERETGIPEGTIRRWWGGRTPLIRKRWHNRRTHCQRGHRLDGFNLIQSNGRPRQCRACKTRANERYRLRKTRTWHPELNPDLDLAPLHHLWLRGSDVLAFILERYGEEEEVQVQLNREMGLAGLAKQWYMLRQGREWIRLDTVDRLFVRIGLVLSEMKYDPFYCTTPQNLPRGASVAA